MVVVDSSRSIGSLNRVQRGLEVATLMVRVVVEGDQIGD